MYTHVAFVSAHSHDSGSTLVSPVTPSNGLSSDALRRHSKTCSRRGERSEVPRARQGRKRRSCDGCHVKKLQCDGLSPCARCISSGIECLGNQTLSSLATGPCRFVQEDTTSPENNIDNIHTCLSFLQSYTDPSHECITDALVAKGVLAEANADSQDLAEDYDDVNGFFTNIGDLFPEMFTVRGPTGSELPTAVDSSPMKVQSRLKELISQLLALDVPRTTYEYPYRTGYAHQRALQLFTPENLTQFIEAYFMYAHPHFPFIHRPTFDALAVSLPLLLAVFLAGSVHCVPQDDALGARSFFELGERYIFGALSRQITGNDGGVDERIQLIQAALLMYCLQMNSNSVQIRRRIRIERFPALVTYGRALGLHATKRSVSSIDPEWTDFIAQETRIRYDFTIIVSKAKLMAEDWEPICSWQMQ